MERGKILVHSPKIVIKIEIMNGKGEGYESKDISQYKEQFEKLKELGRGQFGIVYEVKKKENGGGGEADLSLASKHVRLAENKSRHRVRVTR